MHVFIFYLFLNSMISNNVHVVMKVKYLMDHNNNRIFGENSYLGNPGQKGLVRVRVQILWVNIEIKRELK